MQELCCNETEFVRRAAAVLPRLMWFLGASASRTAGMPTATDIIWDLKRRYYCLHENQDLQAHNVNNQTIRAKIQDYMAGKPVGRNKRSALRRTGAKAARGRRHRLPPKSPRLAASGHAGLSLPPCRIIVVPLCPADAGSSPSIYWTGDAAF